MYAQSVTENKRYDLKKQRTYWKRKDVMRKRQRRHGLKLSQLDVRNEVSTTCTYDCNCVKNVWNGHTSNAPMPMTKMFTPSSFSSVASATGSKPGLASPSVISTMMRGTPADSGRAPLTVKTTRTRNTHKK